MQDFEGIRSIVNDGVIYIPTSQVDPKFGGAALASSYFLAGSVIEFDNSFAVHRRGGRRSLADYVITRQREESPALLTPDNKRFFLYDRVLYDGQYDEQALGSPIIASDWDVYFKNGSLIYVSEGCANTDVPFLLHIAPSDANDLPEPRKQYGFENLDFRFADFARRQGQKCVAMRKLPKYPISYIRTGQYVPGEGEIWEAGADLGE